MDSYIFLGDVVESLKIIEPPSKIILDNIFLLIVVWLENSLYTGEKNTGLLVRSSCTSADNTAPLAEKLKLVKSSGEY
jgi:hypothetical protein